MICSDFSNMFGLRALCQRGAPRRTSLLRKSLSSSGLILPPGSENKTKSGEKESRLLRELCAKIRFGGPLTVAQYMREALTNPGSGYYMKKDVFGRQGDFVTSPEVSQMFGECLGIWIINEWLKMGRPAPMQLVELGPGRGTLMADILRTFGKISPDALAGMSVHLVEVSDAMRRLQEAALCGGAPSQQPARDVSGDSNAFHQRRSSAGPLVSWYSSSRDVPRGFSFFVAHEFFDALPVHKFVRGGGGDGDEKWHEILVDVDGDGLRFVRAKGKTPAVSLIDAGEEKDEVEVCPAAGVLVKSLCERIATDGGALLVADYGHGGEKGDTLRAFKGHALADPLKEPGDADLTADVDFSYLKR